MSNAEKFVNLKRYQFHDDLTNLVMGMNNDERLKWSHSSNLGHVLSLSNVKLLWHMLEALVKLWDPVEMTFKFCNSELTPSLEEFARITSLPTDLDVIVPLTEDGYGRIASTFLGVKKDKLIEHGRPIVDKVGMSYLLNLVTRDINNLSTKQIIKRQNAFDLAVVGSFLFSNVKHRVDLRLCKVIEEMRIGNSTMVPLLLGEMLKSLSDCKSSKSNSSLELRGPVAILQIWVFEHFTEVFAIQNVTKDPLSNVISDYCRKQEQTHLMNKQDWYSFYTKENKIVWRCLWFTPSPVLRIGPLKKTSFPLPCMSGCVSYNPIKAVRQLGFISNIVDHSLPTHNYIGVGSRGKATKRLKEEWKTTKRTSEELGLELECSREPHED